MDGIDLLIRASRFVTLTLVTLHLTVGGVTPIAAKYLRRPIPLNKECRGKLHRFDQKLIAADKLRHRIKNSSNIHEE
jgi:hypothetical protein